MRGYGLKQPKALKQATQKKVATPINEEQFPEYIGDIAVVLNKVTSHHSLNKHNFGRVSMLSKTSCH